MANSTTDLAPQDFYKDLLRTDRSNSGLSTSSTPEKVVDGLGNESALGVTQNRTLVKPATDNTTLFQIKDTSNNNVLVADSTNNAIKVGANSMYVNTLYHQFGSYGQAVTNQTWTAMVSSPLGNSPSTAVTFGTNAGAPASTLTVSTTSDDVAISLFYVWDSIVIEGAKVFCGASGTSTADDLTFAIVSYAIDTGNGATSGDLSDGEIMAVSASAIEPDRSAVDYQALSISSSAIPAGRVLVAMLRNDGDNNTVGATLTMKYHIV
tara:strand:- start:1012 stop:1806 length:795 start_codon:yes stop_codon:yes gene_type:complete